MSWWSKKVKKPLGRIGGYIGAGVLTGLAAFTGGATLPAAAALGAAAAGAQGALGENEYHTQKKLEQDAKEETERANAEAKAIAERKGVEATVDNAGELTAETSARKKRQNYLSTIKTRGNGSLLATAAASGYRKSKLGD